MAVSDRDKVMARMLRQNLADEAQPPGGCMDAGILAAYYEHALDPTETSRCNMHLSQCSRCRRQMAMMGGAEVLPQSESHRSWLWDWRLLASAATALLILTVWGVRRSTMVPAISPTATQPLVAMSKPQEILPESAPPTPLPHTVPSGNSAKPAPPSALDKVSPVPEASVPELPSILKQERPGDLPINGRNYKGLVEVKPTARSNEARLSATQSGTVEGAARPAAAPPPSAPSLQPNRSANTVADAVSEQAKEATGADLSKAKQAQSAAGVSPYAANQAVLAQQAEQRSAATIIAAPDPKVLWRIAGAGFVERSEDAGATWHGQLPEANAHLTAGAAPTTKVCWLVGEAGTILMTRDANHWRKIPPPVPANFVAITAKSASSATVTAADGQRFSTSDGGKKWVPAQ
jgi:hypothetical protein